MGVAYINIDLGTILELPGGTKKLANPLQINRNNNMNEHTTFVYHFKDLDMRRPQFVVQMEHE